MKWLLLGLLTLSSAWAENSKIVPAFVEATRLYIESNQTSEESLYLRPDIRAALGVLENYQIDQDLLLRRIPLDKTEWRLRADDAYDRWVKEARTNKGSVTGPEMAAQAVKIKVERASDTWFKDDVYAYFFVTDGVIPTGKVSTTYKGIGSGESFFFNEVDRAIYPLIGVPAKAPENHLIIDYGIIESDGDDTKEMQKLSTIIIDIAIAVYSSYDPQNAEILINLRKEIQALAQLLVSLNHDDRLATGTFGFKAEELHKMLAEESYVELSKKHVSKEWMNSFEYHIYFRLLRK